MLILHLSDIHFRRTEIQTAQDPNYHLRNELLRDARDRCRELGSPDVVIVSGDVAFAGHQEEFEFATAWLGELCDACGGSLKNVFVVPGNHDVVRDEADNVLVQLLHDEIKRSGDPWETVGRYLRQQDTGRLLYQSLNNYNEFALQFLCDLLPPDRTRARRDLKLNDGSTLRLWGVNTALTSSKHDREGSLFVDPASLQITREDGVVNLVVLHHHLSWLGQRQAIEDHLNDVTPVQLFGHVHTNRITMDRDYMRLTASAAHPDRAEGNWEPGYNLIEVDVEGLPNERVLRLRAHVRVWQTAPGGFRAKMDRDSSVFEHRIAIGPWAGPTRHPTAIQELVEQSGAHDLQEASGGTSVDGTAEGERALETLREVGLRFYRLSFSEKSEIAGRLKLLEDEDVAQPDYERFRRVFLRAHQRGRLNELAEAVRAAEGS